MDEPSQLYGPSHRWTRHNAKFIPQRFIDKYGEELARAIMIDHILLDKQYTAGRLPREQVSWTVGKKGWAYGLLLSVMNGILLYWSVKKDMVLVPLLCLFFGFVLTVLLSGGSGNPFVASPVIIGVHLWIWWIMKRITEMPFLTTSDLLKITLSLLAFTVLIWRLIR
jgi:hypothetical protein